MSVLENLLPGYEFIILRKKTHRYLDKQHCPDWPHRRIKIDSCQKTVERINACSPAGIFLSTAIPNPFLAGLAIHAMINGLPVFSIEEVNQLTLNNGALNHYMLPLDGLGVCSFHEQKKFARQGFSSTKTHVIGWPFRRLIRPNNAERRKELKSALGLDGRKKNILLPLSAVREIDPCSMESLKIQTRLIRFIREAMPEDYRVIVKTHPSYDPTPQIEMLDIEMPDAVVITGDKICISDVLSISDVCVNRGTSMVLFEAMRAKIPIAVIPFGWPTIFSKHLKNSVMKTPNALHMFLKHLPDKIIYDKFLSDHDPFDQQKTLELTRTFCNSMLDSGNMAAIDTPKILNLSLQATFLGEHPAAHRLLAHFKSWLPRKVFDSMSKVIQGFFSFDDIKILSEERIGLVGKSFLRGILVNRLQKGAFSKREIEFCLNFNKNFNAYYFIACYTRLAKALHSYGMHRQAEILTRWILDSYPNVKTGISA